MNSTDIISAIVSGDADDNLDGIAGALRDRQAAKARAVFHTVKAGDKVRLHNLRPKYMEGCTAIVVEHNRTRVVVTLDEETLARNFQAAARYGRQRVTVTPQMIEVLP